MGLRHVITGTVVALVAATALTATATGASAECDCGTGSYVGQSAYQGTGNNISHYTWSGSSWVYQGQWTPGIYWQTP